MSEPASPTTEQIVDQLRHSAGRPMPSPVTTQVLLTDAADRLVEQANQLAALTANDGWITKPPGPEIDDTAEVWVTYKPDTEPDGSPVRPEFAKWAREWWNDDSGDCDVIAWRPRPIVPAPYIPEETR